MSSTLLTVRMDTKIKKQAAKVAESLGFTLSSVVNGYLRQLIKQKRVDFSESYEPTPYLERMIKQARKERAKGKGSPIFDNMSDALAWLNKQVK
jgi:addiction module RelB/DinJ family antitoxin